MVWDVKKWQEACFTQTKLVHLFILYWILTIPRMSSANKQRWCEFSVQVVLAHHQWNWSWEAINGKGCRLQLFGTTQFLKSWRFHPFSQVTIFIIPSDRWCAIKRTFLYTGEMGKLRTLKYRTLETSMTCMGERSLPHFLNWCSTTWKNRDN